MEKNNIIEGNKLIAEFMGIDPKPEMTGFYMIWKPLRYNTSWDELMPVVDKIERIKFKGDDDGTDAIYNYAFLRSFWFDPQHGYLVRFNRFCLHESTSRIEAMWNAVVECIKSFNSEQGVQVSDTTEDASNSNAD